MAIVLCALTLLTVGLAGCGGDEGHEQASGNAGTGRYDPPPIPTEVPEGVAQACDVSSPTIDRIKQAGVLFWAIGISPPFSFRLANGDWAGVEAQNAAELATILGVDFDITTYEYDVLPETLTTGQADIIGANLFVTDEREKLIDFSTPYFEVGQLFYVLEDSPYQTIDDLNQPGVRFVYGFGTAQRLLGEKYLPKATIDSELLGDQFLLHDSLASGKADATMTDAHAMGALFERYPNPPLATIGLNGRVTGTEPAPEDVIDPFDVAFGLPEGDPAWRRCVNTWVQDMLDSGRMTERLDYWLPQLAR